MTLSHSEAHEAAVHRPRRIIMNNDGNDCWSHDDAADGGAGAKTVENFLSKRTSPLVGSQVDAIFYCTGVVNSYTHHSEETELRIVADRGVDDWAHELKQIAGRDSLQVMTDFCHQQDWEVFWSMRMNDTHDSGDEALLTEWKSSHRELLMGNPGDELPFGGKRWSAMNYERPQVREKVFRILQDVATRYDVDGLELDFFRHPVYFRPQMTGDPVTGQHCDLMTELIKRVREMTQQVAQERGRPMLISVRVPDSLGYARAIGLDYEAWLQEGLIDIVVGGGYFHLEPWESLVALGHSYGACVYAGLSASRIVDPSNPGGSVPIELWRGEAYTAWQAGVDGIYTFNRFNPHDPIFHELGSPETLEGKPMRCEPNPGSAIEYWLKGGEQFVRTA